MKRYTPLFAGGIIGTLIAPGVGTAIGAGFAQDAQSDRSDLLLP